MREASAREGVAASCLSGCMEPGAGMGKVVAHLGGLYLMHTCSCYCCKQLELVERLGDTVVGAHRLHIVLGPGQLNGLGRCEPALVQPELFVCSTLRLAAVAGYLEQGSD